MTISLLPLNYVDVPACARNTADAFAVDPHTAVKDLGSGGYDMYQISIDNLLPALKKKTSVYIKAVDDETGEVVGHMGWAFRKVDEGKIPWRGPSDEEKTMDATDAIGLAEKAAQSVDETQGSDQEAVARLHALEAKDMQSWLATINDSPPSMIVLGCIVAPRHQSRGVGSRMMAHGNAMADRLGIPIRVHSSHQAYAAYRKAGFEAERTLDIDLDEYAPRPPRPGEPVMGGSAPGRWGQYMIRYMIREPRSNK